MRDALRRFARNRGALLGVIILALVLAVAASAGLLFPRDPLRIVGPPELWPMEDPRFPLGTDSLGRDIASVMAHGARATLMIGAASCLAAAILGIAIGAIAGFFSGWRE